jgi:hypothetical protein
MRISNRYAGRGAGLAFAVGTLILLLSQPGCDRPAPATEPARLVEARNKRAETLKGEIGYAPPARPIKAIRRR